jgi:3-oxoacyl-[acyl-carrier protein] reductase
MELEGRAAIITGGGKGIGEAIARCMAKEGAKVMIAEIDTEAAKSTTESLKKAGYAAEYSITDIRIEDDVQSLMNKTVDRFGRIDIMVNNAGLPRVGPIEEMDVEDWDLVLETNGRGLFLCCKHVVRIMKKQNSGVILNLTSMHGLQGMPERGPYSYSKAGIVNITRTLAAELGRYNIRVNAIAPGFTMTKGFEHQVSIGTVNREDLLSRLPLKRFGTVEEMANAIIFLASDKASYITGVTLQVDGGWLADGGRGMLRPSDQRRK